MPVNVYQMYSKYTFHVVLIADDLIAVNRNVWQAIYDAKPAHLAAKYYIKLGDHVYYYDTEKKSASKVIKFFMTTGRGTRIDKTILLESQVNLGTARPKYSSELVCGEIKVGPSLSKQNGSQLKLEKEQNLGTGKIKNIKIYSEQNAKSQEYGVGINSVNSLGSADLKFCGSTHSGGGNS